MIYAKRGKVVGIVSVAAAEAAGADGLERSTVEIRGRVKPIEVIVLHPSEVETGASQ